MSWTIQATDEQGRTASRKVSLLCGATIAGDYLVRTDKAVYDGGEPIRVTVLAGGVEPVFLDLIKDGQTVLSESIGVEKGRGERSIDLPPELFGTVVLYSYRYGPEGLPVAAIAGHPDPPGPCAGDQDDARPSRNTGRATGPR